MLYYFSNHKLNDYRGRIIEARQGIIITTLRRVSIILTEKQQLRDERII